MFFIDLTTGDTVSSSGEKLCTPIHFTGNQEEEFVFSFLRNNEKYLIPENCDIVILGDVAEHHNTPMFTASGTISSERDSVKFLIDTCVEEYYQRVKASGTPCFTDICLHNTENDKYFRLVRFNAVADLRLNTGNRPPEPLKEYYTKAETDALFSAIDIDFTVSDVTAVMLEHGEEPYAELDIEKINNDYQLNFSIAVPAGAPGKQGEPGEQGAPGEPGEAGYTPQRGTDYWTAEDIAAIQEYVNNAIVNGEW